MAELGRSLPLGAALVFATALLTVPVRGAACEGHAYVRTVLDPPPAALAGMRIEVHKTMGTQLVIENRTARTLEVLDAQGAPFVRIGPDGVEANLASPSWYLTYAPAAVVPASASADAAPRWTRVATTPTFGWFDPRVDGAAASLPADVLAARQPADLDQWTVPLQVDGVAVALRGRFRYEPPLGAAVARLTSPATLAPSVRVTLLPGQPSGLLISNRSGQPLTVLGIDGEPFLRIGPDGVAANLRSRTWRASGRAGDRQIEDSGAPRWQPVASVPRYGWVDPRTAPAGTSEPTATWTVPMQLGDQTLAVTGTTAWRLAAATAEP